MTENNQPSQELEELWTHQMEVITSYDSGYKDGYSNGYYRGQHESKTKRTSYWRGWTGTHWTKKYDENGDPEYRGHRYYTCLNCGRRTIIKEKFCPNCGFRMIPEEEYRNTNKEEK